MYHLFILVSRGKIEVYIWVFTERSTAVWLFRDFSVMGFAFFVHLRNPVLSSSLSFLIRNVQFFLFFLEWKTVSSKTNDEQTDCILGNEDPPGFVLVLEFCQIISIPQAICQRIPTCTCKIYPSLSTSWKSLCMKLTLVILCLFY